MSPNLVIVYLACLIVVFILGKIFFLPIKKIFKLLVNSIFGGILIYIVNIIGANFNFHIGLNFGTAIFTRNIRNSRGYIFNNFKIII